MSRLNNKGDLRETVSQEGVLEENRRERWENGGELDKNCVINSLETRNCATQRRINGGKRRESYFGFKKWCWEEGSH